MGMNPVTLTPRARGWTPTLLGSALKLWMDPAWGLYSDAGTTVANVGDQVYRWVNRANGDNYDQATESKRPTLRAGANGKRYLEFDPSASQLLVCASPTGLPSANGSRAFSIACKRTGAGSEFGMFPFAWGTAANNKDFALDLGGTNAQIRIVGYNNDWNTGLSRDTNWNVFDSTFDNTTIALRLNGGTDATSARSYDTTIGKSQIGAFINNPNPTEFMKGYIGHYIVAGVSTGDPITSAQRAQLLAFQQAEIPT